MDTNTAKEFYDAMSSSAAFLGALGGLVKSFNSKLAFKELCIRVICGSIIASVCGAHVAQKVTEDLQPIVIFVIGYMGIEAIDFAVEIAKKWMKTKAGIPAQQIITKEQEAEE